MRLPGSAEPSIPGNDVEKEKNSSELCLVLNFKRCWRSASSSKINHKPAYHSFFQTLSMEVVVWFIFMYRNNTEHIRE